MADASIFYIVCAALGYILGSIPFGLVLSFVFGFGDIRKQGSGNIGATNVLRVCNKPLALATLLLDTGKGALAVAIMYLIMPPPCSAVTCLENTLCYCMPADSSGPYTLAVFTGTMAILGHCFPVWLKFKGGKGVATTLGTLLAAIPLTGLAACAIWLLAAMLFKISSLSALIAIGLSPVITALLYGIYPASICAFITLLVFIRHKDNIKRLIKGKEPTISARRKKDTTGE